jgi:hypothetical protein
MSKTSGSGELSDIREIGTGQTLETGDGSDATIEFQPFEEVFKRQDRWSEVLRKKKGDRSAMALEFQSFDATTRVRSDVETGIRNRGQVGM